MSTQQEMNEIWSLQAENEKTHFEQYSEFQQIWFWQSEREREHTEQYSKIIMAEDQLKLLREVSRFTKQHPGHFNQEQMKTLDHVEQHLSSLNLNK